MKWFRIEKDGKYDRNEYCGQNTSGKNSFRSRAGSNRFPCEVEKCYFYFFEGLLQSTDCSRPLVYNDLPSDCIRVVSIYGFVAPPAPRGGRCPQSQPSRAAAAAAL